MGSLSRGNRLANMNRFLRSATVEEVASALKPTLVDGKWRKPILSARIAARLRKNALVNGMFGEYKVGVGGWLSDWDKPQKHTIMKKPKLHAHQRNIEQRVTKIQNAMASMPETLKNHYDELEKRKPEKGLTGYLNMPVRKK